MPSGIVTPIPNTPKWAPREFSRFRSARDKGSPLTNYRPQQEYSTQINSLTETVKIMWKELARLSAIKTDGLNMFPFKIYSVPTFLFDSSETGSYTRWRTFRVHAGCVLTSIVSTSSYVAGTDGELWPDLHRYPFPFTGSQVTVPVSSSQFWFWIEKLTSPLPVTGSYILRWGANPAVASAGNPNPWTTFPSASALFMPIGFVDTLTSGSVYQPFIRQFLRNDVITSGQGTYVTMSVCIDERVETWFVDAFRSGSTISGSF